MKKGLFAFLLTFMLGIFTVSAQVENQGQDDPRVGVVRVQNVDGQHPKEEPPPLPLLHAVDGQQAEEQGDEDIPVG